MDDKYIPWLAGLFEGEGCTTFHGKNEVHLVINMTDKDVIEQAYKVSGCLGTIRHQPSKKSNNKDAYYWCVAERDQVKFLINCLLPWMGERRSSKMAEALVRLEKNRGINKPVKHGTAQGYRMETSRKLPHCNDCRKAMNEYNQQLKKED